MLEHINLESIIFLDVETVPKYKNFEQLPTTEQEFWEHKKRKMHADDVDIQDHYFGNAGIFAEFGRIICISCGILTKSNQGMQLRIKSFYGDDEASILLQFKDLLDKHLVKFGDFGVCGHNINEFDIPYICRRMLINQIDLPVVLDRLSGKKPWENLNIDTMQLWKFGDYKSYISLKMLTHILQVPSPKDDIDGSQVAKVYYEEDGGMERIKKYCQKDVVAVVQLVFRFKNMPLLDEKQIIITN